MRGLTDTLFHCDLAGLVRAGTILVGLAVTTAGYLVGASFPQVTKPKKIIVREKVLRRISKLSLPTRAEQQEIGELRKHDNISLIGES
jgi:hypothetical protein